MKKLLKGLKFAMAVLDYLKKLGPARNVGAL